MEQRSDRIRDCHERAAERPIHEEEEPVALRPIGRQNRGNHNHRQGHEQPQEYDIPNMEEVPEEGEEEVEQNVGNDLLQEEEPPPPPPTLAEVMDRQTWLLENLARRQDNGNGQGKMAVLMRLHPPTFDSIEDDPLLADDWLCTIIKKLNAVRTTDEEKVILATHQLVGATGEWWENYQDAANELEAITWQEFMEKFHEYHIPEGIMEIKAEEFRSLRQGPMTVN